MLLFLVSAIIFWFLFGWFADFSFPYQQAIQLVLCCFKGNIGAKVNRLQKKLQTENIPQSNNQDKFKQLNNLDSQAWLYIEILNQLGTKQSESQERIAKAIEALKYKKVKIENELENCKSVKYRYFYKVQEFVKFITLTQAEKDLVKIESIINNLNSYTTSSHPSENVIQNIITHLSSEASNNLNQISPKRIGLIYKLEELLRLISQKDVSHFNESELAQFNKDKITDLELERDIYHREFKKLFEIKNSQDEKLERYSQQRDELANTIAEMESEIEGLKMDNERYKAENNNLKNESEVRIQQLEEKERILQEFKSRQKAHDKKIAQLQNYLEQEEEKIIELEKQLERYSNIRLLEGKYIGNLSKKGSKYHFYEKCRDWKMLALEHILMPDPSRNVISSKTSTIFEKNSLKECDKCSKNKRK